MTRPSTRLARTRIASGPFWSSSTKAVTTSAAMRRSSEMYMTASPIVLTTRAPREVMTSRAVFSKSSSMWVSAALLMPWAR